MKLFLRVSFLMGLFLAWETAHGETIFWRSTVGKTNLTSTGSAMDGGFQFQLGVFSGGFVPSASNLDQWAGRWVSAQTSGYDAGMKQFTSTFVATTNAAPFTIGAKAYVWGRASGPNGDEWILFRGSAWTWPSADPGAPSFDDWNAAAANEVVLGSINANGSPYLMKSEAVVSYTQWRNSFLAGETLNGAGDDPDHDGVKNLMEFVFGTSPAVAESPPTVPLSLVDVSGQSYLQISLPRLRGRLAAITVEVSSDLVTWNSGAAYTTEISNTADTLVIRDKTAWGAGVKRFMRMKAVLQP